MKWSGCVLGTKALASVCARSMELARVHKEGRDVTSARIGKSARDERKRKRARRVVTAEAWEFVRSERAVMKAQRVVLCCGRVESGAKNCRSVSGSRDSRLSRALMVGQVGPRVVDRRPVTIGRELGAADLNIAEANLAELLNVQRRRVVDRRLVTSVREDVAGVGAECRRVVDRRLVTSVRKGSPSRRLRKAGV